MAVCWVSVGVKIVAPSMKKLSMSLEPELVV